MATSGLSVKGCMEIVKPLELPAHSARALKGMSIGYATATRGGSHHNAEHIDVDAEGPITGLL